MKVLISGGTGFIGSALSRLLADNGYEVFVLTRSKRASKFPGVTNVKWDIDDDSSLLSEHINGCVAVVNLAGDNIASGRWSKEKKEKILFSRINSGRKLEKAVLESKNPPKVFVQASAVGFYGECGNEPVTEESPHGKNFLSNVALEWEKSTEKIESKGVRRIIIRTGMVLGNGGALSKMLPAFKMGVGGPIGSGRQGVSWIHLDDEIAAIKFLIENEQCKGVFNLTAPSPVTFNRFAKTLGSILGKPAFMRVPAFVMKMLMGQMAQEVLLSGQFALPKRLIESEYHFEHVDIEAALRDILVQ